MTSDERSQPEDDVRHRRGLKFRRRDDYAVELFHEALAKLDDIERVGQVLLELGRFYNPYLNTPIVDAASRRAVLEALERGDIASARSTIEQRLASYMPPSDDR